MIRITTEYYFMLFSIQILKTNHYKFTIPTTFTLNIIL